MLISSAVAADNPEVVAAQAAGIPVVKRSDFLGPLMEGQHGIGVAGTHGKTTTTSMIAIILLRAGHGPQLHHRRAARCRPGRGHGQHDVIAARAGQGPFVIEADEYDGMFLGLRLEIGVVTNVEWDHVDCYPTPGAFADAFRQFVGAIAAVGPAGVVRRRCRSAARSAMPLPPGTEVPHLWPVARGRLAGAQPGIRTTWAASMPRSGCTARKARPKRPTCGSRFPADTTCATRWRRWPWPTGTASRRKRAAAMLRDFQGAGRRFEVIGEAGGVTVIDDYAHHPTEIAATLAAARLRYRDAPHLGGVPAAHLQPHPGAADRVRRQLRGRR